MAITYIGSSNAAATGATEVDCATPSGVAAGQIIIALIAVEAVAPGSGPWVLPNLGQFSSNYIGPAQGWEQVCWQGPTSSGVGIEVWAAIYSSGAHNNAMFASSQNAVMVSVAYSGEYNPTGNISGAPPRIATTAQVTGSQPAAPSIVAKSGELVVACAGDLMTASLFGTPSGFTSRVDVQRSGAGTVEATIADVAVSSAGATGPITFPNAAASSTTKGATATLAISPAPAAASSLPVIDVAMPEGSVLGPGWTIRVTALDAVTGSPVSGVTVSNVIINGDKGTELEPLEPVPPLLVNEEAPS